MSKKEKQNTGSKSKNPDIKNASAHTTLQKHRGEVRQVVNGNDTGRAQTRCEQADAQ